MIDIRSSKIKRSPRQIKEGIARANAIREDRQKRPTAKEKLAILKNAEKVTKSVATVVKSSDGFVSKSYGVFTEDSNHREFRVHFRTNGAKKDIGVETRNGKELHWESYNPEEFNNSSKKLLNQVFQSLDLHLRNEILLADHPIRLIHKAK